MAEWYRVVNHAQERETFLGIRDDGYKPHRKQSTDENHIQRLREKANIEVQKVDEEILDG